MAQNFWMAIFAWSACFLMTIVVSLATSPKPEAELRGLVYGLTELPHDRGRALVSPARPTCDRGPGGAGDSERDFLVDIGTMSDLRKPIGFFFV